MSRDSSLAKVLVEKLTEAADAVDGAESDPHDTAVRLRMAQDALLRSEARSNERAALLDAILLNTSDCIAYINLERQILWTNRCAPPAGSACGRIPATGESWLGLVAREHQDELMRAFDVVVATGQPSTHEDAEQTPAGDTVWNCRRLSAVRQGDDVVGVLLTIRDRTDAKQAELQLMVSDRMASLGTLAAGVAHEINNPLAAVITNLELVSQSLRWMGEPMPHQIQLFERLDDARASAYRVRSIVRDLKVFSRGDDPRSEAVNVETVLDSTLRMAWNAIRHRARVVKEYGAVPPASANEARLGQVFLNLVMNAAQAIPEGRVHDHEIRITTFQEPRGGIVVQIADTGCGIPPEVARRLFTPFFTTKAVGVGTGLGLSICRRILTSLGGDISFEARRGGGTVFTVRLPRAVDALPAAVIPIRPFDPPAATRRGKILIVDDEVAFGVAVQRLLGEEHDAKFVDSGREALAMLRRGDPFDVILCDLMMPDCTGMELHAEVATFAPDQAAAMVFISGGAFSERAVEFLASVENHRIDKPFVPGELREFINGLVR